MKEQMENGAKIADAIQVLVDAKLLTFKKNEAEDAEASLKLNLRAADVGNTDEEVIVLAVLHFDETEQSEMGTDIIYYTDQDAHPSRRCTTPPCTALTKGRQLKREKPVVEAGFLFQRRFQWTT